MSKCTYPFSKRCAACKCLRRKCPPDCILAQHFPPSNPQRFASVHKIFGAANVTKILEQVPVHLRSQAADCMIFEADTRIKDPVYGSVGVISQLQQQIMQVQKEILKIHGEIIALQNVQMQQVQEVGESEKMYCGPGCGLEFGDLFSSVDEVEWNNGQRYQIDLDETYVNFTGKS